MKDQTQVEKDSDPIFVKDDGKHSNPDNRESKNRLGNLEANSDTGGSDVKDDGKVNDEVKHHLHQPWYQLGSLRKGKLQSEVRFAFNCSLHANQYYDMNERWDLVC